MTMRHGKLGVVTWDTGISETQANVKAFALDCTNEIADATTMDNDTDFREYVPGFNDWTATVDICVDTAGILLGTSAILGELGVSGALALSDGTTTYTGTGIVTNCEVSVGDDVVTASYTFEGSSQIS